MHIELTEMLQCPEPHPPEGLVLSTGAMRGRRVVSGLVGCPVCRREYPIVEGVVAFGTTPGFPEPRGAAPDPATLQALLDVDGPGGFIVLFGGAVRDAAGLAARLAGVHFVAVNPPAATGESAVLSVLRAPGAVPLRSRIARGVVVGGETAASWLAEAGRVLLPGRRLVVEREPLEPPPGIRKLAAEGGLWVGTA